MIEALRVAEPVVQVNPLTGLRDSGRAAGAVAEEADAATVMANAMTEEGR
ncbi:hypothetical protein [Streptomyces lydicus]|nr:hypothetical protein [Streptomyces lydicus]MCZ1006583.1 hypothetical protein [Streptomyces lydicus]